MEEVFKIPVVIFFFRRVDTTLRIIERLSRIRPQKVYLLSDGGRSIEEQDAVIKCREKVEEAINWNCEIVRRYPMENLGVYKNIGLGAKWVFEREERAIFLEDDNLPALSFFDYCKELLDRYEEDTRVLWICGTNYLENYVPPDGSSYVFTKHLLPCGWASWAKKYNEFYDGNLTLARNKDVLNEIRGEYLNKSLYKQQKYSINSTINKLDNNERLASWDFQMAFAIRVNSLYGISPTVNLIENIGVDDFSTHGGNSFKKVMTRRFCGISKFEIKTPLIHPKYLLIDQVYEKKVGKIILLPFLNRVPVKIVRMLKPFFGIGKYESLSQAVRKFRKKLS